MQNSQQKRFQCVWLNELQLFEIANNFQFLIKIGKHVGTLRVPIKLINC